MENADEGLLLRKSSVKSVGFSLEALMSCQDAVNHRCSKTKSKGSLLMHRNLKIRKMNGSNDKRIDYTC